MRTKSEMSKQLAELTAAEIESLIYQLGSRVKAEEYLNLRKTQLMYAMSLKSREIEKLKKRREKNLIKEEAFLVDLDRIELIELREKVDSLENEIDRLEGAIAGQVSVVNSSIKKCETQKAEIRKLKLQITSLNVRLKDKSNLIKELRQTIRLKG
ncbi:hypothetical protein [Macrococcus capreoli]|uniref:hypothetical protein n=1 Tax=Macrococcus capreoli TaxID=2982690 RepID=UPI003EE48974